MVFNPKLIETEKEENSRAKRVNCNHFSRSSKLFKSIYEMWSSIMESIVGNEDKLDKALELIKKVMIDEPENL